MYPLNEMLGDLHAAGFTPKELTQMKEPQISYLYVSLITDSWLWNQRLVRHPHPDHPGIYPNPEISLAQTLGGMTADEKTALRQRLKKA